MTSAIGQTSKPSSPITGGGVPSLNSSVVFSDLLSAMLGGQLPTAVNQPKKAMVETSGGKTTPVTSIKRASVTSLVKTSAKSHSLPVNLLHHSDKKSVANVQDEKSKTLLTQSQATATVVAEALDPGSPHSEHPSDPLGKTGKGKSGLAKTPANESLTTTFLRGAGTVSPTTQQKVEKTDVMGKEVAKSKSHKSLDGSQADLSNSLTFANQLNTVTVSSSVPNSGGAPQHVLNTQDPNALVNLGHTIASQSASGQTTLMHVQVLPGGMGQLGVTVTNGENGVQIQVMANQTATFEWLNQQLPQLQQSLQDAGLNVSGFQLSFGQSDLGQGGDGRQQKGPSTTKRLTSVNSKSVDLSNGLPLLNRPQSHDGDISLSV